ncbi:MAG: hypothetical protein C4530_21945 [Desulfobacteraceae bacterium]|nr:MAG: hypothetical protein C4530_21945 [Desulfobacteraceae bacterium]
MTEKKNEEQVFVCPVGRFFSDLEASFGRKSKFCEYLTKSGLEFLKAVRSFVDERIEDLEKGESGKKRKKKMTKIEVE